MGLQNSRRPVTTLQVGTRSSFLGYHVSNFK